MLHPRHNEMANDQDVIIIGAGPSGLVLAVALADAGLTVTLVEKLSQQMLTDPQPDGRDIALTHRSIRILHKLGLWQQFPTQETALIREARVFNGVSSYFLGFNAQNSGKAGLGYLVPNYQIRKIAFEATTARASVKLLSDVTVTEVSTSNSSACVRLSDGRLLKAPLAVAADSRFSETRRRMGIGADLCDFGRVAIVCRMVHDYSHQGIAYECFHYGHTLAILPLNGQFCSVVITVPAHRAETLMQYSVVEFEAFVCGQIDTRLGGMRLVSDRHAYPLVAVYAHRFVAHRFALLGDAAVGMHPVTAHSFNFGLYGVESLSRAIRDAPAISRDIGSIDVLSNYQSEHQRTTLPIYLGTNALVRLFTDDRFPARVARAGVLRLANLLEPLKAIITQQLTGNPS